MILVQEHASGHTDVVVRPHRSMGWRGNLRFVAALAALTVPVSIAVAALGAWPVLPIAGFDVLFVLAALYWVSLTGRDREVVRFSGDDVIVEKGRVRPESRVVFAAAWVKVEERCGDTESAVASGYKAERCSLYLGSHGNYVVLGEFLSDDERKSLCDLLTQRLRRMREAT